MCCAEQGDNETNHQASFWLTNRLHEALTQVFLSQPFKDNTLETAISLPISFISRPDWWYLSFLSQSHYSSKALTIQCKSNNFIFLVCPIPRHWEKQDDRKAQKVENVDAVTLSEGSVGKYFGLPISVTLSWVHLCQKSSELSAACQASKRFFEKILLHIPRKSERYNKHCRHKHKFF